LPGSGKSTRAKKRAEEDGSVIISKDLLRETYSKEKEVSRKQDELIEAMAKINKDIIIDNTHCNIRTLSTLHAKLVSL
jgi:adenylate kinase family enzyme